MRRQKTISALSICFSVMMLALPSICRGHGGLPFAQQILWRDQTMLVPTPYWGLFVGTPDGPFRWICEEIINADQQRLFAIGNDGTLYATDRTGLTVSRDGGCTWAAVTTGINTFQMVSILGDPITSRVWVLATDPDTLNTGLWKSDDAGQTWQSAYRLQNHWVTGLRISEDGQTLAVTSMAPTTPRQPTLHVSHDGGSNFVSQAVSYQVDGQDIRTIIPLWIDPRAQGEIYIATKDVVPNVLLRIGATGSPIEMMRVDTAFRDMMRDPRNDQLLVSTSKGLWASKGGAILQPLPTLSATQCLSLHGDALYACAWNYAPDMAALARLTDDATHYTKVFQYHETKEPVSCPASTPAGQMCPSYWQMYADQLGVDLSQTPTKPPESGTGCSFTSLASPSSSVLAIVAGLVVLCLRRRRPLTRH